MLLSAELRLFTKKRAGKSNSVRSLKQTGAMGPDSPAVPSSTLGAILRAKNIAKLTQNSEAVFNARFISTSQNRERQEQNHPKDQEGGRPATLVSYQSGPRAFANVTTVISAP